ncbi:hypothetical protein [Spiribacter insolitus]|uniref:Pilus assembly protein n=1 Tax=Spiribacter insolitus TaxID=3122417 RepID=A0ABV3T8D1_9GAMM
MLETLIALPVVLVLGLSVAQWAFIHEARAVLDHATLMAARAGALNSADMGAMRNAFARAITPMELPRPTTSAFETTFIRQALPDSRINLELRLLNPTQEAFSDHARRDRQGRRYLPYRRLDRASTRRGRRSGLNIQDATLLRVQARFGYELKVPYANAFILQAVRAATRWTKTYSPRERLMLANGRLPIVTTATVRMQSRAYAGRQYPRRADLPRIREKRRQTR